MPQKISNSRGTVEAAARPGVDVLIVTALKEEYDAVLQVDTGARPESPWKKEPGPTGLEVAFRTFHTTRGGGLRVAVTRPLEMGGEAVAGAIAPLIHVYTPRCLAMCGVCAGREGEVELGDVLIADVLWNYEFGKLERERTPSGQRVQRFKRRHISYQLDALWKHRAESFQPDSESPWLKERPRPYPAQMDWVLECLLLGDDPAQHSQRRERCANYAKVMDLLRQRRWVSKGEPRITKTGERYIRQRRGDHPDGLPEPKPFRVHVGPIATGNKVHKDPDIFEKLSDTDYKVLGVEMEASSIGALAHLHQLEYMLVMKGVMDFADPAKNDNFKPFAARASAECLLAFLRENLPAPSEAPPREHPTPRALARALRDYKRTLAEDPSIRRLDLRGLVGIAQGQHRTELDLLDFAVAPSLQVEAENEGSRAALIQHRLNTQELSPDKRRELEAERDHLERARWANPGDRGERLLSFARVLRHSPRFVIIGDAGSGKSVLTRLAVLACSREEAGWRARLLLVGNERYEQDSARALLSLRRLLPVRLTLGTIGGALSQEGSSLEQCIREELGRQGAPQVVIDSLGALLAAGRLLLLLDGLDEVPERQRECVVDAVKAFARQHEKVRLLATSRPHGYNPRLQGFDYTRLAPLHSRQQHQLVASLHHLVETYPRGDEQSVERARRRTDALMHAIRTRNEWRELSSNPLLLTLCALTSADIEGLPKHRVFLFENFLRTLVVQWRSVISADAGEQLLEAWSTVASELVQREQRGGVTKASLLDLLDDALQRTPAPPSVDARNALRLALETGLVLETEELVRFWHLTFAEFLAAYHLTAQARGAADRLLGAKHLTQKTLQFAAARLRYVLIAQGEAEALARGLLDRDEKGANRLLRPGLRDVSACMRDGVHFGRELLTRVWRTWTEVLESTPPSPRWEDFGPLTEHAPPSELPEALVARLARVVDHGLEEVRPGLARLVAPYAARVPAAREACERWLAVYGYGQDTLKLHAAYGLASAGDWAREEVISRLGRFGASSELPPERVGELVRQCAPTALEPLRALVRLGQDPDPTPQPRQQPDEQKLGDSQISAACLLAVGGAWDGDVARVLRQALVGRPSTQREAEVGNVVRTCADELPVQQALLEWMGDDSTLGSHARQIVGDVAPLLRELPRAVLERTVRTQGKPRQELEALLRSVAEERPAFLQTLRQWLEFEEDQQERWLCAANLMLRLAPGDARLHEALRRGMRSRDAAARVRWAHLALGVTRELSVTALATLQACARSAEPSVRALVYDSDRRIRLWHHPLEGWLACASDPAVPDAARLDAVIFLDTVPEGRAHVVPLLGELLGTKDPAFRASAVEHLSWRGRIDAHATLVAEEAARSGNAKVLQALIRNPPSDPEVVLAFLRALPAEPPAADTQRWNEQLHLWAHHFAPVAARSPACVESLLDALEQPGLAGEAADRMLRDMLHRRLPVQEALRKRLGRAEKESNQLALRLLIDLCLDEAETRPAALEASRALALQELSPRQLRWFAERLDEHAPEVALPMWLRVLEGDDPWLMLRAAEALVEHWPEKTQTSVQPALARVFDSPEPSAWLNAARLALEAGLLEERARAALLECLASATQEYRRGSSSDLVPEEKWLPEWKRLDLLAIQELHEHWPDLARQRLLPWLEEEEQSRFTCAVKLLAKRSDAHEAVHMALERRLGSAPDGQLEYLRELVDEHGFFSTRMAEQLLTRYHAERPPPRAVEHCLRSWLYKHPEELWALLRRQEPARRVAYVRLLQAHEPWSRDTVSLAVELVFAYIGKELGVAVVQSLRSWCNPSESWSLVRDAEQHARWAMAVRGWLREVLDEQALPDTLATLDLFDSLAHMGGMPTERRIEVLRRALDIDLSTLESEETSRASLLEWQADLGLRLLDLGCRDERLPALLEAAVYESTALNNAFTFRFASALLKLRPVDEALRRFLIRRVSHPLGISFLESELEFLEQHVGLSHAELVAVLVERLEAHALAWPENAPAIFEALERHHCEPERRAALLLGFVSQCGTELKPHTRLALAKQDGLSASDAARLVLGVITQRGSNAREAVQQWLERFATRRSETGEKKERWLMHVDSHYLSHRLEVLARLSEVDEPAWLEQLLAELVTSSGDEFLALYRRARAEGAQLSDADWAGLAARLSIGPDDADTTRLGKEWLTLGLWRAMESSMLEKWLSS